MLHQASGTYGEAEVVWDDVVFVVIGRVACSSSSCAAGDGGVLREWHSQPRARQQCKPSIAGSALLQLFLCSAEDTSPRQRSYDMDLSRPVVPCATNDAVLGDPSEGRGGLANEKSSRVVSYCLTQRRKFLLHWSCCSLHILPEKSH